MPNRETVRALVSAFNVHNYARNTVKTNFTLQSRYGKDYIVVSFDKSMKNYQCSEYLYNIGRKIVGEFYDVKGGRYEVVLNTGKSIFDVKSFPFNTSKGELLGDEQNGFKFVIPIDQGVIFNLKSHLAASLAKDVLEDMPTCNFSIEAPNKKGYLWHGEFDKESRQQFESKFLSRMENRYGYRSVFKKPLKVEGNDVYIKDVFDNARFIDSVTRRVAWLIGMYLGVDSSTNHKVRLFKDMIVESIGQLTEVTIDGFVCASPLDRKEASILLPLVLGGGRKRILTNEEALKLNCAFNYAVFNDLYGRTQGELSTNGSSEVYGIDFSDPEISHCVITKIIESSVINAKHELSIDPELPRTLLTKSLTTQEFPTGSRNGALERSPRQGSEKEELLFNHVNSDGPSEELPPRTHLSSSVTNTHSLKCVGAVQNVPAGTSAWSHDPWSLQSTSGSKWQPSPKGDLLIYHVHRVDLHHGKVLIQ